MKKLFNSMLLFFALVLFLAGNSRSVLAATTSSGSIVNQITPQDADVSGEQMYKTKLVTGPSGYYEVIPVQVSTPGVLVMKATGVATGKGVGISLHNDASATTANRLTYNYLYSTAATAERKVKLEKKGTYYLRVETSDSSYSAGMEQEVDFSLRLYPASKTLKSGKTYHVGQAGNDFQYYTLKVNGSGYIRVNLRQLENTYAYNFYVNLFNSKGKAYNKNYGLLKDGSLVFAVKKGTYKIGVKTSNDLYSIKATFKKYTDQAGDSKKKAKTIKKGKTVKSMVVATDKTSKSDWFKFTLSKAAKPKLVVTTEMALGRLRLKYYSGKSKFSNTNTIYSDDDKKGQTEIQLGTGISAKGKLPKGTYYVQVTPTEKGTSGIYSIKLKY